ncbi:MAG: UDP-glucose lipid carrier transferase [uncultured Sulfurovum sp.]|uniref:UDP-glucose lipid carrier transferase n=1 Tax=uncultured Sulfurovum sp. TaxID=269237 RepID=A0A6S6T0H2_9BACT|nr:MAG: UDP-glucose lipid carrier transferase [uncultured Sulfurovum sp.]
MTYSIPKKHNRNISLYKTNKSEIAPTTITLSQKNINKKSYQAYTKFQYLQKRTVDFFIGGLLFFISMPVIIYTIYRIRRESPGPIFFKQTRIGLNGKTFTCYKFRSMHSNSKFNPYTQENDSRIFPFGNIMRQMRIDELPQLFNIIKGEMHLIGPRAEWDILVKDYEKIIPNYHDRHLVAPGITGLAQVQYPYGRNIKDAKNKLKYDRLYIDSWSLFLELKVVWRTIKVILGRRGM